MVQAAAIADQTIAAAMAAKDDLAKKLLPVNSPPAAPPHPPPPRLWRLCTQLGSPSRNGAL